MHITIAISTVDRSLFGCENYFGRTIDSLLRSGLRVQTAVPFSLLVFNAGGPIEYMLSWLDVPHSIYISNGRLTSRKNCAEAMRTAGLSQTDWVVYTEDDVRFCNRFIEEAAEWLSVYANPFRVVVFYCPYREVLSCSGVWHYPIENFYGTQCVALRREDALSFGNYLANEANKLSKRSRTMGDVWSAVEEDGGRSCDFLLKDWSWKTYPEHRYFGASAPSLVQHIGKASSLGWKYHTSPSYTEG